MMDFLYLSLIFNKKNNMQNDPQQFEIIDMTPEESPPPQKRFSKKHFIIFGSIFLAVLVLIGGGYFVWDNYLSPSARSARQAEANYQKYLDWQKNYEAAMTADTYGGKTPQETLNLFVDALKKGDTELASKYFLIDEKTPQSLWKEGLDQKKADGKLQEVINMVEGAKSAGSAMEGYFGFEVRDAQGKVTYDISMIFNKYSNVWKIETM